MFVDGPQAVVMALLQLLASALAFTWLFRLRAEAVPAGVAAFCLVSCRRRSTLS